MSDEGSKPTYHDLHITTTEIPRTRIADLPFGVEVSCNRVAGWCLWETPGNRLIAGEYNPSGLRLDVNGTVICDSL